MHRLSILLGALLLGACSAPAPNAADLAAHYLAQDAVARAPTDLEQAARLQDEFVARLVPVLGDIVGYKAGLTSRAAQQRFGIDHPLRGTLLRDMLLPTGATLTWRYGARPMAEADLLVRVGSDAINEASTDGKILAALDAVIPFIELVDLVYRKDVKLDAAALLAINVGARYGAMGDAIELGAGDDRYERLGRFTVQFTDANGRLLGKGSGADLLGHPVNVVRWLRDSIRADGRRLHRGDLLSLGSLTALIPVTGPGSLHVVYSGLAQNGDSEAVILLR